MFRYLLKYKGLVSLSLVLYLVVFNTFTNSSKTDAYITLEKLSDMEQMELNQLFYAEQAVMMDSFLNVASKMYRFNGTALVAINHQPVLRKAYGYKNLQTKSELTPETSFQLASVSKQFTAIGILKLIDQGKLSLEEDVKNIIPELPYENITIEHLLNHTSGLPNYMWLVEHKWGKESFPTNEDVIDLLHDNPLQYYFNPGRKHDYSNTGYVVLATIIEHVSGKSFSEYMQNEIFDPVGMSDAFVLTYSGEESFEDRTRGYFKRYRRWREYDPTLHDGIVGDKGIYASVDDLFKWDQALYYGSLVSDSLLNKAFTKGKIRNRWVFPYGYGFRIKSDSNGAKIVYHNGRWESFRNSFYRYIDEGNTIILLSNSECRTVGSIRRRLEYMLNKTSINQDLIVIQGTIQYGYSFGKQLFYQYKSENPDYKINSQLLESSIQLLDSYEKSQLSLILEQMREFS